MEERSISRIKCAMVIYEFERALGRFVRDRSSNAAASPVAAEILKRSSIPNEQAATETTRQIVENSYLGEVLSLARLTAKGTSDTSYLSDLERLCTALGIFDIRNAISHPNRPFPDCYWYRCAAVAADPAIDKLDFFEVTIAFQNALNGKLEEPPENWMYKKRWSVPTILPNESEHAITGLVGRTKDISKLEKELRNPRAPLIALVARGGVGKTSLLLQVISDFCLTSEVGQYLDGVLWTSFKQERLTAEGIETLSAPSSLHELELLLCRDAGEIFGVEFESFASLKERLGTKRLLLCLDNLETLLRDAPENFNSFYEALPSNWKVVVTSRIPVDSAKNIPLDVLDNNGAAALCRTYLHTKGAAIQGEDFFNNIAKNCNFNPLAIRLTIDLYLTGVEISHAVQKIETDVLSFSFTNLLDQLTPLENNILEVVFVLENPNRAELCSTLSTSADDLAEAISNLSKTSLLVRSTTELGESYTLGNSIRDLLRAHPRNLDIRSKTVSWIAKAQTTAQQALRLQQERQTSPVDLSYIPADSPLALIAISKQINAARKREDRKALAQIERQLRLQLSSDSSGAFLNRLYAWVMLELDDVSMAVQHFQKANQANKTDPAALFGLALAYQDQQKWTEVHETADKLIQGDWGSIEKAGKYHANRVWSLYLQTAVFTEQFSLVFEKTNEWEKNINTLPSLAIGRAMAYREQGDIEYKKLKCSDARLGEFLGKSSRLMTKICVSEGFAPWLLPSLKKLIGDIEYDRSHNVSFSNFKERDRESIRMLMECCISSDAVLAGVPSQIARLILKATEVEQKSASDSDQSNYISSAKSKHEFESEGFHFAKVKYIPKADSFPDYIFAYDESGSDYFVRIESFEKSNWNRWALLRPGMVLAIKYLRNDTGKAHRTTEAWIIE